MFKKILAVVLSGMLVFGAGMSVCAAEAESEIAAAATEEGGLGSLLGGLMNSLGSEEGSLDGILSSLGVEEGSLDGILSSLGAEGGSLDEILSSLGGEEGGSGALLGMLLGSLGSEEGNLDGLLGSVLGGLSGEGTESGGFNLDLNLSAEDLAGLGEALSDPENYETLSGLFAADGLGTAILDIIGSEDNTLGALVVSLKSEEGGYDIERIITILEGAEVKEDSIVIDEKEISAEELREAVTGVMELLGLLKN